MCLETHLDRDDSLSNLSVGLLPLIHMYTLICTSVEHSIEQCNESLIKKMIALKNYNEQC